MLLVMHGLKGFKFGNLLDWMVHNNRLWPFMGTVFSMLRGSSKRTHAVSLSLSDCHTRFQKAFCYLIQLIFSDCY